MPFLHGEKSTISLENLSHNNLLLWIRSFQRKRYQLIFVFCLWGWGRGRSFALWKCELTNTVFIQIVQAMVNDADRGSHASGEITHSWMKILFGQALGGAEGRSVPNGFSIWATYWEGSYCPWVVGGQRSVGTWEICWVFLVSVVISVLRHFLDMLKFFTGKTLQMGLNPKREAAWATSSILDKISDS